MNSIITSTKVKNDILYKIIRRWRHKPDHWSVLQNRKFPKDHALEHFDDFYKSVYGDRWKSIRVALLSSNKYCAVVNNFADTEKTIKTLENNGALNMRNLFDIQKKNLKTQQKDVEKKELLEKIYKLDEKLDRILASKELEEIDNVYKDETLNSENVMTLHNKRENNKIDIEENEKRTDLSLKTSIDKAVYDTSRIIDPSVGVQALYEYIPATKIKGMEDWILESDHYRYYDRNASFPVIVEKEYDIKFPEHLNIYTYERGNISRFDSPKMGSTGVFNYFLLDGGSVLPVLALDLKPKDKVLDMCAAPGGKSLMIFQTLCTDYLVCNDIKERTKRISKIFREYVYNFDEKWKDKIVVSRKDARDIDDKDMFDKILVDVPCTTDRHALHENDNNIFKPARKKERLKIPELQSAILSNALELVKVGGTVVYSTCSLSPIQNDGVVHMALEQVWEKSNIEVVVKDLEPALKPLQCIYQIANDVGLKYGHLVIPFLPSNFGPMYFCKLVRKK